MRPPVIVKWYQHQRQSIQSDGLSGGASCNATQIGISWTCIHRTSFSIVILSNFVTFSMTCWLKSNSCQWDISSQNWRLCLHSRDSWLSIVVYGYTFVGNSWLRDVGFKCYGSFDLKWQKSQCTVELSLLEHTKHSTWPTTVKSEAT